MIFFETVSFAYPGGEDILKNLTFRIEDGEQVALIGANGAGKSTLMKAALGLIAVQGTIRVDGMIMNRKNLSAIRKAVGYVLQNSDHQMFMPTVLEDMIFGPMNYGLTRAEAEQKAIDTLQSLDLSQLKDCYNHKLSGGEKRMAAIATVLAMEPKAILMDEPTSALDPYHRRRLIQTLQKIPGTKLIATHDLDFCLDCCDRVLLMGDGKIIADGPADTILRDRDLLESNHLELPLSIAR